MTAARLFGFIFFALAAAIRALPQPCLLPVDSENRSSVTELQLTRIGGFGVPRKARPKVPAHLHTGIDIQRPHRNYRDEPIFPVLDGKVISVRDDGPYAQIIIEHEIDNGFEIWTVYEHIAGITVTAGDSAFTNQPVARFMNLEELNRYGWQFDHVHFEILREAPRPLLVDPELPSRFFASHNLECYTSEDLDRYYFDPIEFMQQLMLH